MASSLAGGVGCVVALPANDSDKTTELDGVSMDTQL